MDFLLELDRNLHVDRRNLASSLPSGGTYVPKRFPGTSLNSCRVQLLTQVRVASAAPSSSLSIN